MKVGRRARGTGLHGAVLLWAGLVVAAAALAGCGGDVACVDTDSQPPLCYHSPYCYEGGEGNAADEEHADSTCADLGFAVDCGDGDFYDVWATSACPP